MQSKPNAAAASPLDRYLNYFKETIDLTIAQPVPLLIGAAVASILGIITFGILALPLIAGLEEMYLKARRKQPIKWEDVFAYNSKWLEMFKAFFIIYALTISLPAIAALLGLVARSMFATLVLFIFALAYPFFCAAWYMHVPALIAQQGVPATTAMSMSKQVVQARGGWVSQLLPLALLGVLNALGTCVAVVGVVLTAALSAGLMAFAYVDECGDKTAAQAQPDLAGSTTT